MNGEGGEIHDAPPRPLDYPEMICLILSLPFHISTYEGKMLDGRKRNRMKEIRRVS